MFTVIGENGKENMYMGGTQVPLIFDCFGTASYSTQLYRVAPVAPQEYHHQRCAHCTCTQTKYNSVCERCGAPL
jgi:uncharacterized paraquat-inducible protein A